MSTFLTPQESKELEYLHREERNGKTRDRIKAVLLSNKGWTKNQIAEALFIHPDTVYEHLRDYKRHKKLSLSSGGSDSKLSPAQTAEFISHLEKYLFPHSQAVADYVRHTYKVEYSANGMTAWLHDHGFSYKHPTGVPAKINPINQAAFVEAYNHLKAHQTPNSKILFFDGMHPTMGTKTAHGWIKKGHRKPIATTASRTRMNIAGSIDLETMEMPTSFHDTIDSSSLIQHLCILAMLYPDKNLTIILDQASYNTCQATKEAAQKLGISLMYLPAYSPNLNPIERVWKLFNEHVRNNVAFADAKVFRQQVTKFFTSTWQTIAEQSRSRVNDNFQIIETGF